MIHYDFDEVINRNDTDALKIDALEPRWGRTDLLPLWIADMDLRTPPFIMEALQKRCRHEILGYTCHPDNYFPVIRQWLNKRYDWHVAEDHMHFIPGIVPGIAFAVNCFTAPGDKIMIQPPVYHPFSMVINSNRRELVTNPLILENGQYKMDMEHFRSAIKGCRMFILCNPHNPGGTVWDRSVLEEVAEICYENQVLVISDEIHGDLTLPPLSHIPFASVSEKASQNSIVFMSPSKAFNMPGLASSYSIIENDAYRKQFYDYLDGNEFAEGHMFAFIGLTAAYTQGEEWLGQMLAYVQGNIDYLDTCLKENIPLIRAIRPQASYLVFLDCRDLNLNQKELVSFFTDDAHLALNDGTMFGKEGTGFMRINVGCPKSVLTKALGQLESAYKKRF